MKEYEIVWEILNECPNNQMRDIFFEERMVESPEAYILQKFAGEKVTYRMETLADGSVIYYVDAAGIHHKCSFTEI